MRERWVCLAVALAGPFFGLRPAVAQELSVTGQVRPRHEFRDPTADGKDESTSMRVRLALEAELDDALTVFVQLQDVRLWGEETHPLFDASADRLDLHQGYLRFGGGRLPWLTTTAGRFEIVKGGQRLLGALDWAQQGQSFDGLRFGIRHRLAELDVLALKIADETAPAVESDEELYGAYLTVRDFGPGAIELYWLYDRVEGAVETDQHSSGARYVFGGVLEGRLEGTVQRGTRAGEGVSAFMLGARLGRTLASGRGSVTLWYDLLSGDDPETPETEAFSTLFATNHKFYGFADLFLDLPVHTGGAGLQDAAVKFTWALQDDLTFGADFHVFAAAERRTLASRHFADELDLTLRHRYSPHFSATAGLSWVLQGAALAEIGRLSKDLTWLYIMLDARF